MAAEGSDGSDLSNGDGSDAPADGRESLDVPEWVSELRRLYVEPKTRAKLRQEGAIAPQKRKLGLPGLRGSRRSGDGNGGDRAGGAHSTRSHAEQTDATEQAPPAPSEPIFTSTAAVPPPAVPPAELDAVHDGGSADGGSDTSDGQPQPIVEEQVGAWLNSYLVATGHAADDADAGAPAEDRLSADAAVDSHPAVPASGPIPPTPTGGAADSEAILAAEVSQPS